MKLLPAYIRQRKKIIVSTAACCLIFLISFWLYSLPMEAALYPMGLCLMLVMILLIRDYRQVCSKVQTLQAIRDVTDIIVNGLPQAESLEEEAYQRILELTGDEQKDFQTRMNQRYTDMVDYYTIWVHQIKTPIASMRLNLQNEESAFSRKLSADLFRIEQYVEMVLMFLRLNSETSDYVIKECDLDPIIRQSVKKFAGEFIGRKISLIYEPFKLCAVTDEKWMAFVIEQILSNALKYTPSGSIRIYLEEPKILCIQDTGIGIAPEDLPRIFEKGYTGYNGRSDKKASGIGLFLCRRICRNLGHEITAESEVGRGTTIRIDLSQRKLEYE